MKREAKHDLLDGGLFAVVLHDVHLVHVARVAEGDELGDPALVVAASQLVQQGHAQRTALREDAHGSKARLGETRSEGKPWKSPDGREEQRIHVCGVVHTHAVGSDDTALVLVGQTHDLILHITVHDAMVT